MNERIEIIVYGHVQMVMYRDFASRTAQKLGLVGAVKNLPDGTVAAVAEGSRESLEKFITHLRRGPLLARVDDIDITNVPATGEFTSFNLIRNQAPDGAM